MSRNDELINKADPKDIESYDGLVRKALKAKIKIETGFFELAESIY